MSNDAYPMELSCTRCGRVYSYNPRTKRGHTKIKCNSCCVNERRFKLTDKCIVYLGGSCQSCGYNKCSKALCFHHRDPTTKDFTISGNHCKKWSAIRSELDKCVLLCSNCHSEVHAGMTECPPLVQGHLPESLKDLKPRKKPRYCLLCNDAVPTDSIGKYCSQKCRGIARRRTKWPSKEELESQIGKVSWLELGRIYGVSDNAVRKWARRYGLL